MFAGAPGAVSLEAEEQRVLPIETAAVQMLDSYEISARYAGRIAARRSSDLGFERGGLLAEVAVDEGAEVARGDVLASLDTRTLEAQLAQARAAETEAKARLALSDVTVNRQRQLVERQNVSQQRYDEARFERQAVSAQLEAARANIKALEVSLELASIRAPYDGSVVARMVDEGTVVSPGQPIFRLLESASLEAHVGVPPDALPALREGMVYQVTVREESYPAVLTDVLAEVDAETRTVTALLMVDAPPTAVRAGELVRLPLSRTIEQEGFWVPIAALTEGRRGLWSLYVVVEGPPEEDGSEAAAGTGILERRAVQLLHTEAERAYVRGTLRDGEHFVANGTHRLVPGQRVRVSDTTPLTN